MDTLKIIFSLVGNIIDILFPLAIILLMVGTVVRFSGEAPSIREGIVLVLKFAKNAWHGESTKQQNIVQFYDEEQLQPLTERLSKYFSGIVFDFCKKDDDLLWIKYEISEAGNFQEKLAETDARNFFRRIDNLHPGVPVHIFLYPYNGELTILRGISDKGIRHVQEQKFNKSSREIPKKQASDIIE